MIAMGRKKKTYAYEGLKTCPHCGKSLTVKVKRKVIKAAVRAEIQEELILEENNQSTLADHMNGNGQKP